MIIPIILSGGNGTRLWPLSNNKKPKQFIKLINDNTLFTETILRFKNKDIYTEPIILSNIKYNELILEELKNNNLYKATIFFEPISRNTAPAIANVVNYLVHKRPNDIALFLPSDAYIDDVDRFTEFLIEGEGLAQNDKLVCFGIKPTYPETGYGYIKSCEKIGNNSYVVDSFTEKPDLEKAIEFLKDKNYFWNAGIFMCKVSVMVDLFDNYATKLNSLVKYTLEKSEIKDNIVYLNNDTFKECEDISIDYALIEKLNKNQLAVVSMNVIWSDVGSYKSLFDINNNKTVDENVIYGNVVLNNTNNCYISSKNKIVCCSDVDDLVVIEEGDYILVMKKSKSQNVREIVRKIQNK